MSFFFHLACPCAFGKVQHSYFWSMGSLRRVRKAFQFSKILHSKPRFRPRSSISLIYRRKIFISPLFWLFFSVQESFTEHKAFLEMSVLALLQIFTREKTHGHFTYWKMRGADIPPPSFYLPFAHTKVLSDVPQSRNLEVSKS